MRELRAQGLQVATIGDDPAAFTSMEENILKALSWQQADVRDEGKRIDTQVR
ncbi:hypothetical protein ABVT39_006531 [Epinephelus coioides]